MKHHSHKLVSMYVQYLKILFVTPIVPTQINAQRFTYAVTPAQLMRPVIGQNASCTVGEFA